VDEVRDRHAPSDARVRAAVRAQLGVVPRAREGGYVLEARLRRSAIKDGEIIDQMQYAFVAPE
jgi:hypothetical protein